MQPYKRQYRELDDETKQKISAANRNRPKSEMHRQHISQSMKDYWAKVPHRPSAEMSPLIKGKKTGKIMQNKLYEIGADIRQAQNRSSHRCHRCGR